LKHHLPEFKYDEDNLMITAQHTHSGPSGYSYYGLYNLSTPGFVLEIYRKIVDGIVEAIVKAENNVKPAELQWSTGVMEPEKEVAYQRSIDAYNLNPEVKVKATFETRHLAVNREMTLLKINEKGGKERGSVNWYAVHPTNLPNTNHKLCGDNKGFAATYLEEHFAEKGNSDYVGVFAQGNCGDVTPRMVHHPVYPFQRGQWEGKFPDDMESAKFNGRIQFEKAKEIAASSNQKAISGEIDYELMFVNFTDVTCDPKFTRGKQDAQTGKAAMGVAFFTGTKIDGPGMHPVVGGIVKRISRIVKLWEKLLAKFGSDDYKKIIERKYRAQGVKDILVESNTRRILGTKHIDRLIVPAWADPAIATFKYFYKKVGHTNKPWTPKVLPIQLFILR